MPNDISSLSNKSAKGSQGTFEDELLATTKKQALQGYQSGQVTLEQAILMIKSSYGLTDEDVRNLQRFGNEMREAIKYYKTFFNNKTLYAA